MENIKELKTGVYELIEKFSFSVNEFMHYPESFGNIIFTIQKDKTLIRFFSDRGDLYVELGTVERDDEWIDFQTMLKILFGYDDKLWRDDILGFVKHILDIESKYHNELQDYCGREKFKQFKETIHNYQMKHQ